MIRVLAFGIVALAAVCRTKRIKNEPNLEKRAQLALENAQANFKEAQADYAAGKGGEAGRALADMQSSVELARDSLDATGKIREEAKVFQDR